MPTPILMPALSPTMEEGKLAKWLVREGDQVSSGDIIAEIETDKATMEVEAVDEGRVGKILVAEGAEHIPVNQPIALLLAEGEEESASSFETRPSAAPQDEGSAHHPPESPYPKEGAEASARSPSDSTSPSPQPSPHRGEGGAVARARSSSVFQRGEDGANGATRVFASPLARRIARERGIDLGALHGSGPHGRIVKRDIAQAAVQEPKSEQAEASRARATAPQAERQLVLSRPPAQTGLSDQQIRALYEPGSYDLVPHDTMRRVIAERLTLAKQTIPHFYLSIDCRIDALLKARKRLNELAPQDGPRSFRLSVNDFVIKALAMALQQVPRANATWTDEGILLHRSSDIAVAVALPGGGLFTPVVRSAEVKSLSEISNEMRDFATRARSKRLAPHEYQGGTTAISNLGMYGIAKFDAVINPPHASILAVGKAEKRPVVRKDKVKVATMMSVTLSVDHRVIDGALGAELLAAFKDFIEDPVTMLV